MSGFGQRRAERQQPLHVGLASAPHAEQAIIGALLDDPQAVFDAVADRLLPAHFHDKFARIVFDKGIELVRQGNVPDAILISAAVDGYVGDMTLDEIHARLREIFDRFPSASNAAGWASIILDKHTQREIVRAGERLQEIAHAQDFNSQEKLAQAQAVLNEAGGAAQADDVASTKDMLFDTLKQIEARNRGEEMAQPVSYGFADLDDVTTGAHEGELIVVAGRPGMGKTAFAMAIAKACAKDPAVEARRGVLMFSLEMSVEQMGMRWLSSIEDVPLLNMRSGQVTPEEWARLQLAMDDAPNVPFYVDRKASCTIDQIRASARRRHKEDGLGLVVVDYLQLIEVSAQGGANRAEALGEISRGLKNLARELKIPVVALSQLNRAVEQRQNKRPVMSDLRESGAIEQDADIIMFLYRDEYYNPNTTQPGVAEVIIGKQRNGPPCTIKLGWGGSTTSFHDLRRPVSGSTSKSVGMAFEDDMP